MKYCGTMANIWIEFSIKGEREKEQKYQIIIQDIDFTKKFLKIIILYLWSIQNQ